MTRRVLGRPQVHGHTFSERGFEKRARQPQTVLPADLSHISEQMVGWDAASVIRSSWISLETPPIRALVRPPQQSSVL